MATTVDGLKLRAGFGRKDWLPPEPFGPDGWLMDRRDGKMRVIATAWEEDGVEWVHASISGVSMPTYYALVLLHNAVWGDDGYSYQHFVPKSTHVNIAENALHLFGRADGKPCMPNFGKHGTI